LSAKSLERRPSLKLVNIAEAARLAGVSEKTLRRAINISKTLAAQPHRANQPILIAVDDLNTWIASRQVQAPDSVPSVRSSDNALHLRITDLEQLLLKTQEALSRVQQETETLRKRVITLETAQQDLQDFLVRQFQSLVLHLPIERRERALTPLQTQLSKDEPSFTLANFSRGQQSEYKCTAQLADVKATWILLPYLSSGKDSDEYAVEYCTWDSVKSKGHIKPGQKERGEALKEALIVRAREEMLKAGWIIVQTTAHTTIYAKEYIRA
jgi:hypothetical protein